MPRVLLLGGSGRLGSALRLVWDDVVAPSSTELNIKDEDALARYMDRIEPEGIVNCAGLTDVDGCERDPQAADELNGYAPGRLAARAARNGIPVVHLSTDYVFSGDERRQLHEDDPLAPVNRYGQSKARGEGLVLDSGAKALVARVQWLFGGAQSDFVRFVRGRLLAGQEVPVVRDQIGTPSYTMDLATQLAVAWQARLTGIINLGNSGEVSREEQAQRIAQDLECTGQFRLVTWLELGRSAARPRRSVLDTTRIRDLVAARAPQAVDALATWHDAQGRYLKKIEQE